MGSHISNNINLQTQITNNFLQESMQTCSAHCDGNASGNVIIIGGHAGNVDISARCTASASCIMTNQADSAVKNVITNITNQEITTVTDFLGDLSFNDISNNVNINNTIANYITQITTQTCNSVSNVNANDNFIFVQSGGSAGNFSISAEGNASASCAMSNMSKIQAYNQVQNSVSQSATEIGMFAMIFIAIIAILLIGGIIFLMMFSRGSTGQTFDGDTIDGGLDYTTINSLLTNTGQLNSTGASSLKGASTSSIVSSIAGKKI